MKPDIISSELKTVLKRLRLSRMLDTLPLPERFALARQQKMPHQDFLPLALSDEASRRDGQAATLPWARIGSAKVASHSSVAVRADAELAPTILEQQKVEGLSDYGELIDSRRGVAPDRRVVGRGRRRPER